MKKPVYFTRSKTTNVKFSFSFFNFNQRKNFFSQNYPINYYKNLVQQFTMLRMYLSWIFSFCCRFWRHIFPIIKSELQNTQTIFFCLSKFCWQQAIICDCEWWKVILYFIKDALTLTICETKLFAIISMLKIMQAISAYQQAQQISNFKTEVNRFL